MDEFIYTTLNVAHKGFSSLVNSYVYITNVPSRNGYNNYSYVYPKYYYTVIENFSNDIVFFIEGVYVPDDYQYTIEMYHPHYATSKNGSVRVDNTSNGVVSLENFTYARYYIVRYGDYILRLYPNQKMIRGYLSGMISIKSSCADNAVTTNDMIVHCYRSADHQYIGEYDVVSGGYNIPNLNVNFEYDLVFVDKTRTFEHKVLSKRTPTPY